MEKKYGRIYSTLLRRIHKGTYAAGTMMPTERELTEEFDVTRNTVRRAIEELINGGYLYRKPSSGAFVCEQPVARSLQRLSVQNDKELKDRYQKITTRIVDCHIFSQADAHKEMLGLKSNARVYHLRRIQYGDDKPIVYESIYLPCEYFTKLGKDELEEPLEKIVKTHAKFSCAKRHTKIVVEAKASTKQLSSYLELAIGQPLLRMKMTVTANKIPYYYYTATYSGTEYDFLVE
jgi:GntR family transcriptional regulator